LRVALPALALFWCAQSVQALTPEEIMDEATQRCFGESFRAVLSVNMERAGKLVSKRVFWLMGRMNKSMAALFLDFQEPEEVKGLRYLVQIPVDKDSSAFMYMPAAGQTLPFEGDSSSVELGGAGFTMDDISVFVRRGNEKLVIEGEEKVGNRDCYVVRASFAKSKGERLLWITKKDFIFVKSQTLDANRKVKRIFKVTELFRTADGRDLPRKEEIIVPETKEKITLTQEHLIFGIATPDELWDPITFGAFRWKE